MKQLAILLFFNIISIGTNSQNISYVEPLGNNEVHFLERYAAIQKYKNEYWALESLMVLKNALKSHSTLSNAQNFYKEMIRVVDSLGLDMGIYLMNRIYGELNQASFNNKEEIIMWHKKYNETFKYLLGDLPQSYEDKNVYSKTDVENLYWKKCVSFWNDNESLIKEEIEKASDKDELEWIMKNYEFLLSLLGKQSPNEYCLTIFTLKDNKEAYFTKQENLRIAELEQERRKKEEERKRKIASGELCECCNNKPVNCYRCDGKGFLKNYSWVLQDHVVVNCPALCDRGIERCSCCKILYKR